MADSTTILKPCPFCGGEAELDTRRPYRAYTNGEPNSAVSVYCTNCVAEIMVCNSEVPDTEPHHVVAMWNARAVSNTELDLATLVRRLSLAMRKTSVEKSLDQNLVSMALSYLQRHGLNESILRSSDTPERV